MTYQITFKSGKIVTLRDILTVDYYNNCLYFSDSEATYTFPTNEVVTSECVGN